MARQKEHPSVAVVVLDDVEEQQPASWSTTTVGPNQILFCGCCGRVWGRVLKYGPDWQGQILAAAWWSATEVLCPDHPYGGSLLSVLTEFGPQLTQREIAIILKQENQND